MTRKSPQENTGNDKEMIGFRSQLTQLHWNVLYLSSYSDPGPYQQMVRLFW